MSATGRYRIQTVADMTGVSAATLRAWERRYGIPAPQRTASAYRLYSDDDVELVRRVRKLSETGIAPAQAVQMVQTTCRSGVETIELKIKTAELAVEQILAGVDQFDADMIEAAVRHAMFIGSATALFEQVFGPVLAEIGARWYAGTMSVAQEHLASRIIGAALNDIFRVTRPNNPTKTAVLACLADEEHELPLLGVALRLAEWNVRAVVLGARTPPSAVHHAVTEMRPDLVGLSITTNLGGPAAAQFEEYAAACGRTPWIVGGQASHEMRGVIEGWGGIVASSDSTQWRAMLID